MGDAEKFNKTDMERVGIFQEMGYISIGDKYKSQNQGGFNTAAGKGKQLLPGGSKERSALQHGYFAKDFTRVFENEAYSDPIKTRRQVRLKEAQKNIGKPFLPSSGEKMMSGLGNHYGTLGGPVPALSPASRGGKAYKAPGKNFYTNPGKHGTGFGYLNVTLGPYQKASGDLYDKVRENSKKENEAHRKMLKGGAFKLNMHPRSYFDENPYQSDRPVGPPKKEGGKKSDVKPFKPSSPGKTPGGNKSGTFDPYPSHSEDRYTNLKYQRPVQVVNKSGKTFMPSAGPKSAPVSSVVNYNVIKTINRQNFNTIRGVTYAS